jgi:flagellar basal body-associated protein FliL
MAENNEASEANESKPGMMGKLIVWGVVFVLGAGTGAAVPIMTGMGSADAAPVDPATVGLELMDFPEPGEEIAFIPFEEVVANINDPSASRYTTCTITLQVAKTQEEALTKLIEEKSALLKNWLIGHLRDKTLEQLRGKLGVNLLRREIYDNYNEMLFTDGIERIQDVLLLDFKIQ